MAYEITLPRLGWDMVEGVFAGWLKADGTWVNSGDLLFNVEGDKAVQEIEAMDSGYLRMLPNFSSPGEKVPVGTVLGFIVPKEEMDSFRFPQNELCMRPSVRLAVCGQRPVFLRPCHGCLGCGRNPRPPPPPPPPRPPPPSPPPQ